MSRRVLWLSLLPACLMAVTADADGADNAAAHRSARNTVHHHGEHLQEPEYVTYYHPGYYESVPDVGRFAATYYYGAYHSPIGVYAFPYPYPYPGHFAEPAPNYNASYGPVGPWVIRTAPAAIVAPAAVVPLRE